MDKPANLEEQVQSLATGLTMLDDNQKCLGSAALLDELQKIFDGDEGVCRELLACFAEKLEGRADNITTQYELLSIAAKAISHKVTLVTEP